MSHKYEPSSEPLHISASDPTGSFGLTIKPLGFPGLMWGNPGRQGPYFPNANVQREIGMLLPNNQRQHRTLHIQKDVLPYALC